MLRVSAFAWVCEVIDVITKEELLAVFRYDKATGSFYWNVRRKKAVFGGKAGAICDLGYVRMCVNNKQYLAHRLVWLVETGSWPSQVIDHINGIKSDNRFENLRDVDRTINGENVMAAKSNNACGYLGVRRYKNTSRFSSSITHRGKAKYLGAFSTPLEAHKAYLNAKRIIHPEATINDYPLPHCIAQPR